MSPALKTSMNFLGDCRGVSAVEFAFLMPVMMTLFLGSVETTQGIAVNRKVTLTTHALADLASQYTDVTNADMSNILAAGSAIIAPYASSKLQETVSEVAIDANGVGTVVWSDTLGGTALSVGTVVTVPSALAAPNSYLVLSQVQYSYAPTYGYVLTGTISLHDQIFMRPRQSNTISRTAS
ncbi:MAG TPA: TadE/TadG family type IV pilus assembly protein [Xanthobacteraceae bacterium]|jgi:Flp pilus assembly protein TadG|nr:TadE/TadG family type IV pilus assembly protein [Xanthobacteraceae bacterium]